MTTAHMQAVQGYELQGLVAQGGFGAVYRAAQPGIGRQVAIKVILPQYAAIPSFIRRFEIEAQTVARLEHPHIVPLYDYWRDPGGAYLVMRWMQGGSLAELLGAGPLPLERVVLLFDQLASALALAHRRGVLHRDIKPANVLLDAEGNAYLADFGIAAALADDDAPAAFTPGYAAPEQVRLEALSLRSDLYSLALVLYEMLTGARAFGGLALSEQLRRQLEGPPPSLAASGLPAALDAVLQRALAADPLDRYPDVPTFAQAVRSVLTVADSVTQRGAIQPAPLTPYATVLVELEDRENPYKGLRAFQEADAADFFGRDAAIDRLLARLAEPGGRMLAVVGPSGSGKSSLVRAGLLPRLRVGALPGADTWYVAELYPGPQPFAELEQALLAVAASAPPNLLQRLQASSKGLLEVANELLPADPQAELLLLIDQFEELFTQVSDEGERAAFLALLQQAASDPQSRVRVLLTLRADFYDRPLLYPAFGALLRERTEVVLPLSPAELEQAISRPAQRVGAVVAPELVAEMVEEVATRPGALPLLQYALTELFDERKGRAITLADYRARGGLRGALARRADAVYEQLDAPGQAAARQIFLRLVTLGEGGEDTRRRALVRELRTENSEQPMHSAQSSVLSSFQVLTAFSNARLLTFDHDPLSREPTVEVAHEALIRSWGRLRSWIDGGREELRLQRALASAAAEWRSSQRDASFLARGARLGQFLTLAPANGAATLVLNADEQAFLEASSQREQAEVQARELARQNELAQAQALAQAERQRAEEQIAAGQRLRRRAIWLALALVVALLGLGAAGWFGLEAQRNATAAATERDRAEQQLVVADAQRLAFAAQGLPERSFETRLLLAIEAARRDRNLVTERVLRDAYARADWSTTILPHGEPLLGASFSRDGGLVLAAAGTTLTVWDTTGKQLFSFAEHSERIRASNSLPGDKRVVSGDQAGVVRLFDIHEGLVKEAKAHDATVIQLDYSPAAQLLVSTSEDDTARIWSSELEPVAVLRGHGGDVYRAMFSDDGRLIATVSEDKTVRVWQNDGKPLAILRSGDAAMTRVDWSPDGTMLAAAGDDGKMRIWDVATIERDGDRAQPIATVGGTFEAVVTAVEFRNDNRYLLFATFNGSIRLYAVDDLRADGDAAEPAASSYNVSTQLLTASFNRDGNRIVAINTDEYPVVFGFNQATSLLQELATLYGHGGVAVTARWSPDGQRIVSAGEDGTARIWSNVAPALLQDPTPRNYQMAVTPDERFTLTTYRTDDPADPGRTQLWDSTGKPLAELGGASTAAAFDEQESLIATGDDSGTLQLWALDGTKVADLVGHSDIIRNIRFSKDGQRLLSCSDDGRVFLWDRQGEQLALLEHETEVWHAEFSPDRTRIVTAASDGARLWDGEGRLLKELGEHTGRVDVALYSPDGTWFATGSNDDTARIWDNDGNLLAVLQHRDDVYELAFSDDGSRLMSVSADTTAKIWNRSGKLLLNLQHRTYVSHGGFTSDNRYYVTEAMDTVHLWNREGIEVATFEAGSSLSRTVYMPEGGRVLIIVRNGIRYEYPIDLDLLQQAAECRVGRGLNAEEIALYAVSEPLRFDFAARECGK